MKLSPMNLIRRLAGIEVGLGKAFIANFSFSFLNALLSITFTRIYVRYLGAEGYGIIGFYNSIAALFYIFDFGVSTVINREMAKALARPEKLQQARNMARSLEIIVLGSFFLASVVLVCLSFLAAYYWVTPKSITRYEVLECFLMIGFSLSFQLFSGFYLSGLMGMEKHILVNFFLCLMSVLRYFGSAAVLIFISGKIQAFLLWQLLVAFFQSAVLGFIFWKTVSGFYLSRFDLSLLKSVYRFALGISFAGLLGLFVLHIDRIILSGVLDLEELGYYSFSIGVVMMVLGVFINPLYNSTYPLFSKLVASGEINLLVKNYHRSCQLLSFLVIPFALFVAFFSREILHIWLKKEDFVNNASSVLSVVSIAWIGASGKIIPHRLRLAYGWVRLDFYENLCNVLLLSILMVLGAYFYGVLGAAIALCAVAYSSALLVVYITHRKILEGEYKKWLVSDNFLPFLVSLSVIGLGKYALEALPLTELLKVVIGLILLLLSMILLVLIMKDLQEYIFDVLVRRFS
jgi:O-antigen/teichoic acid export membrane protein